MTVSEILKVDLTQGILFPAQSLASMCQEAEHVSVRLSSEMMEDIDHVLDSSNKLAGLISDHISSIENPNSLNTSDTRTVRHDMKNPLNVFFLCKSD